MICDRFNHHRRQRQQQCETTAVGISASVSVGLRARKNIPLIAFTISLLCAGAVHATITRVGNGDDGGDLEGGQKITSGILIETRAKALERARGLQVGSVENLGTLLPELEKSEIYLVPRELAPKTTEDKGMESSADGKSVYARTFAEPHAATRFFPAALTLNEEQLVALHIHEALHRSLPPSVRENEEVVTRITLAISSPDATFDRIQRVTQKEIPPKTPAGDNIDVTTPPVTVVINKNDGSSLATRVPTTEEREIPLERPSSITYGFRSFLMPKKDESVYPVKSLHSLQSFLYPFGTGSRAFGVGLEFTYIQTPEQDFLGPLSVSGRVRLMSIRGFDVSLWGSYAMNTASADELKNSPLGRDVPTLGLSMKRETNGSYVENLVSVSGKGEAKQSIGSVQYTHQYGTVTAASIRAGGKYRGFELGGFAEVLLADFYRVSGGAFTFDSGRYRIIGAGPELSWSQDAFKIALIGCWVIDSTPGVNLDYLGDIMGRGVGQGFFGSSLSFRF